MSFSNTNRRTSMSFNPQIRQRDYFILYTLLFMGIAFVIYRVFSENGKSLIWGSDGINQHYNALVYLGQWGRETIHQLLTGQGSIPLWDFNLGYGADILTTLHYYVIGDPLALLSIAVPSRYTEFLYAALILLRLYLAGIAFSCYCFRMKKDGTAVLTGSFTYIFCLYALYAGVRHPYFLNPMIYLPFLLIGAERIFAKEKPTLFIFMVFLSAISNFYFFYMLVFAVIFYAVIRFFTLQHINFMRDMCFFIRRFFIYGIIGTAMSAILLLPVILLFLGTYRTGVAPSYSLFYLPEYYQRFVVGFLTSQRVGNWTLMGFTAPAFLGICVLFSKRKQLTALKAAFLVQTVMLCLPMAGSVLNGFSYVCNRWCWFYAALVSYILVCVWPDLVSVQKRQKWFLLAGTALYLFALLKTDLVNNERKFTAVPILLATAVVLTGNSFLKLRKKSVVCLVSICLVASTFFHVCLNAYNLYDTEGNDYVSEFIDSGTALETITDKESVAVRQVFSGDTAFGRYEREEYTVKNTDSIVGVPGLSFYWSLANGTNSQYLFEMSMNNMHSFLFRGLDHRTFLDALASVKYYVGTEQTVPFGFEKIDCEGKDIQLNEGDALYQNQYVLPLGYTYSSFLTREVYDSLSPAQKQEALLQSILLEDSASDAIPGSVSESTPTFSHQSAEYQMICKEGVQQQEDGSFLVSEKDASLKLEFTGMENCETYLFVSGVSVAPTEKVPQNGSLKINVETEDYHSKFAYVVPKGTWYSDQSDFLVNLGYQKEAKNSLQITFPVEGVYQFENMEIVCQPMDNYVKQVTALKENTMEQEEIGTNYVKGSIQLDQEKLLCLTIPYDKGWTAYVDGKKTELLQANTMFMALPLTAGTHTIELRYQTYGLKAGAAITAVGFLFFFFIAGHKKGKKRSVSH